MKRISIILAFLVGASAFATFKGYFSAEEKYDPLNAVLQNSLKAKLTKQFVPFLDAYMVAGNEGASTARDPFVFQIGSFAYAGPGIKLNWNQFSLSSDVRFRRYLLETNDPLVVQPLVDAQALFTYEDYWEMPLAPHFNGFVEAYSETLFSSADYGNISHNSLVKVGGELAPIKNTYVAAFLEPSVLFDTIGHYYNNRAELRVSGRIRYKPQPAELELTVSYLLNGYFNIRSFEENPYPSRNTGIAAKLMLSLRV
ncbi:MAG: hypothetical protein H6617_10570 [Bdellovibrionaceae bacterium]|nr:hypothetical protein [Bdellovibrionales bacterium]MCB9255114.1 hypothetical protein [Pseudobdellovibrionaceae bacterium]